MYTPDEIRDSYKAHKLLYVAVKTAPFRVIDIDEQTNRIELTQAVRGSSIYKFYYEGGETLRICTDPSMRETNLVLSEILSSLEMTSANLFQDITYMNFKPHLRENNNEYSSIIWTVWNI